MRKYKFPCKKDDIEKCCDIDKLLEYKQAFELCFMQIDADFGGEENIPESLKNFFNANKLNLKNIERKISRMQKPLTSAAALKRFHDKTREMCPEDYDNIVRETMLSLGRKNGNWLKIIRPTKIKRQ